jgi:hypothetical protein
MPDNTAHNNSQWSGCPVCGMWAFPILKHIDGHGTGGFYTDLGNQISSPILRSPVTKSNRMLLDKLPCPAPEGYLYVSLGRSEQSMIIMPCC